MVRIVLGRFRNDVRRRLRIFIAEWWWAKLLNDEAASLRVLALLEANAGL